MGSCPVAAVSRPGAHSTGATVAAALGQVWRSELDRKIRGIARKGGEAITGLPDSCDESPRMIPSSLASAPLVRQNYRVRSSRPRGHRVDNQARILVFILDDSAADFVARERPARRSHRGRRETPGGYNSLVIEN